MICKQLSQKDGSGTGKPTINNLLSFSCEMLSAETRRLEKIYQSKIESLEGLKRSVLGKVFAGEL